MKFHNLVHTKGVVNRANEIAGHYQLSDKDMLIIYLSSWFHDTGYLLVNQPGHEAKSVDIMREFTSGHNLPEGTVEAVAGCIMSTMQPRNPTGLLQEIICDADTYHFGKKEFKLTNKLALEEAKTSDHPPASELGFMEKTYEMLEGHHFYTTYCKNLLDGQKNKNMKKLKKKIDKQKQKDEIDDSSSAPEITEKAGTTKGMQTMLRLTSENHVKLSDMADSKANILISVNAIIISVILSVLLRKLQTDPYLTIPTIIFLASALTTIVIAILATRPKVNAGTFDDVDVINKKTNLLFFGNYHRMQQDQYENAMRHMMSDSDYLYSSIIQDIYHLGVVLGKKYRLIRLAYNIFMIGIIVSVLAFAAAAIFYTSPVTDTGAVNASGSPF
ncbi:MAG: Pycsar system effector family protein [Ferruginibacter sp.]